MLPSCPVPVLPDTDHRGCSGVSQRAPLGHSTCPQQRLPAMFTWTLPLGTGPSDHRWVGGLWVSLWGMGTAPSWAHWCSQRTSRPPLPSCPLGTSLVPSSMPQSPVFRNPHMPPGCSCQCPAEPSLCPRQHDMGEICSSLTEISGFGTSALLCLAPSEELVEKRGQRKWNFFR